MTNLKEKEIRDYLNTRKNLSKGEAVCEIFDKFGLPLDESLAIYNEYEQFEKLIEDTNEAVERYINKSETLKRIREKANGV